MTVTISSSDVANDLAQDVLASIEALKMICDEIETLPGLVTFNIAYAYVLWEDVEQIVDFEIEIPR